MVRLGLVDPARPAVVGASGWMPPAFEAIGHHHLVQQTKQLYGRDHSQSTVVLFLAEFQMPPVAVSSFWQEPSFVGKGGHKEIGVRTHFTTEKPVLTPISARSIRS